MSASTSRTLPPEIAESVSVMALIERGKAEGQIAGDDVRRAFEADQIPATQWKNVLRSLNQILEEEGVTLMVSAAEPKRTRKSVAAKSPAKRTATKTVAAKTVTTKRATATATPAATAADTPVEDDATANKAAAVKKTVAKKASALKVKEGEGAWTKAEIKEVLDDLHEDRERVTQALRAQEAELVGLMRDAGDGAGHDQADMGATSFERDHELTVLNNEREKLAQIDRALARIEDGTYGICESCGNPIGKMRAMAFPRATLCLTCKQREERR